MFCECGAWKNFFDLEDSISLDELILLYEASVERNNRLSKIMAASFGAEIEEEEPFPFLYSDSEQQKAEKTYQKAWMADPKHGGEVTPSYGEEEINQLPINLGYSIIEKQE